MPHRQIMTTLEDAGRGIVMLWEPAVMAAGAASAATLAAIASGVSEPEARIMALAAFAAGFWADFQLRGRAWSALPECDRKPRWAELNDRFMWAALGLAVGVLFAWATNGMIARRWPEDAPYIAIVVNFCWVLNALLMIELIRGLGRLLSGQGMQEAFAGLVINWARRRAGEPPAPPSDNQGGQGDA